MTVCTLPAPVSPELFAWCPRINTVLFVSETHLIMCRQSGQQVWSTKLVPPGPEATPLSVSWSPDGQYFALVFSNGSYSVHNVSNGRQLAAFHADATKVASVAWATTEAEKPEFATYDSHKSTGRRPQSHATVAAIGTVDGRLKINVYGTLCVGEIELNEASRAPVSRLCVDEDAKEYAAVQESCLYVYRMDDVDKRESVSYPKRLGEIIGLLGYDGDSAFELVHSHEAAQRSARVIELASTLAQSSSKYAALLRDAQRQNNAFFQIFAEPDKPSPLDTLLAACLFGPVNPVGVEWIRSQHEQGFIRWYKALHQGYDAMRKVLGDEIMKTLQELLEVVSDLPGKHHEVVLEAHALLLRMAADTMQGFKRFELLACYIEYLFRDETDRPIAVTRLTKVSLSEVAKDLVKTEQRLGADFLGLPSVSDSVHMVALTANIQTALDAAAQETRDQLRSTIQLRYSANFGTSVRAVKRKSDGSGYKALLNSGEVVTVDDAGNITAENGPNNTRQRAVFTGKGDEVVSLLVEKRMLVLPSGETLPLEFQPRATAARYDGENVIVCVLSEDCQHYQFLTL